MYRRILVATVTVLALSLAVFAAPAPSASARSAHIAFGDNCYNYPQAGYCNGDDPSSSGCSADATTVPGQSKDIMNTYNPGVSYGKVELRWSNHCGTNWVRIRTYNDINIAYLTVWHGYQPGTSPYCYPSGCLTTTTFAANQTYWTDMVYAPTSPAGGSISYEFNPNYIWQEVDVQSA